MSQEYPSIVHIVQIGIGITSLYLAGTGMLFGFMWNAIKRLQDDLSGQKDELDAHKLEAEKRLTLLEGKMENEHS